MQQDTKYARKPGYQNLDADSAMHRRIAERAFILFQERGYEQGNDWAYWFEAEQQVRSTQVQSQDFIYKRQKEGEVMRNGHYYDEKTDAGGWSIFLAGALIGAGVAMLFAPQRGSELRGLLRNYADRAKDDLMDKGQEAWDTAVERGKEYYKRGEEAIYDAGRSAKEFATQGQEAMKDGGRSAKEYAKQGQNAMEEAADEVSRGRG